MMPHGCASTPDTLALKAMLLPSGDVPGNALLWRNNFLSAASRGFLHAAVREERAAAEPVVPVVRQQPAGRRRELRQAVLAAVREAADALQLPVPLLGGLAHPQLRLRPGEDRGGGGRQGLCLLLRELEEPLGQLPGCRCWAQPAGAQGSGPGPAGRHGERVQRRAGRPQLGRWAQRCAEQKRSPGGPRAPRRGPVRQQ